MLSSFTSSLGSWLPSQHFTRTGPFLTGLSSWELGMQALLFLNLHWVVVGEVFAEQAERSGDWHVPLSMATAEGPLGSALLLTDGAAALAPAAEQHLCFPSSFLQHLGTQPRPTLIFPSQASRKIMFPGKDAGNMFAYSCRSMWAPAIVGVSRSLTWSSVWYTPGGIWTSTPRRRGGGCSCGIGGEPAWQHGLQALLWGHLLCSLPGFYWPPHTARDPHHAAGVSVLEDTLT